MRLATIVAFCGFLAVSSSLAQPPKREVRAVWIATAAGLDWPKNTNREEQQYTLRRMVQQLADAHFNTMYFQVRARGDAYYHSRYEPWAENLTGTLGRDPGWDPLALLLNEAHARGMEVHAWFNVFKVRGIAPVGPALPEHPWRAHPSWTVSFAGEGWFDPGIPEARAYLLNVALDLTQSYDIDGINFDFVRYPGREFPDTRSFQQYGRGIDREVWRRDNISKFIAEFYGRAIALKPMLKVGSSPLGIYDNGNGGGGVSSFYQDARAWIAAGTQDYLSPQIYWSIGENKANPDFNRIIRDWQGASSGRHIIAGIGAYKSEVFSELISEIDATRKAGAAGESYFRYENIARLDMFGERYLVPALIPPMPWKDAILPNPPANLAAVEISPRVFSLEWTAPERASDGDLPKWYVVYRSPVSEFDINDPRGIVTILPGTRRYFVDTVRAPSSLAYHYAVTSIDKGNNESAPSRVATATVREALALRGKLANISTFSLTITEGNGLPRLAAYKLEQPSPVTLSIHRELSDTVEHLQTTLVRETQQPGVYIVGLGDLRLVPGKYLVRLSAGQSRIEQRVEIQR